MNGILDEQGEVDEDGQCSLYWWKGQCQEVSDDYVFCYDLVYEIFVFRCVFFYLYLRIVFSFVLDQFLVLRFVCYFVLFCEVLGVFLVLCVLCGLFLLILIG